MEKVIRTENKTEDGLLIQYIFGLNIFTSNRLERDEDLEVEFLKILGRETVMSAHTRNSLDFADSPVELFGPPRGESFYELVSVAPGAGNGKFFLTKSWPIAAPCFFPKVTDPFWDIIDPESGESWSKILFYDAVVFYLEPRRQSYLAEMRDLFTHSADTYQEWMKNVLEVYRVVLISVGDMNYFEAFAKDEDDFDVLAGPIDEVEKIVRADPWYRENQDKLVWDGERGMCLVLPSSS